MPNKSKTAFNSRVHLLEKRFWDENDIGESPNEVSKGWKDSSIGKDQIQEARHVQVFQELNDIIHDYKDICPQSNSEKLQIVMNLMKDILFLDYKLQNFKSDEANLKKAIIEQIQGMETADIELKEQSQSLMKAATWDADLNASECGDKGISLTKHIFSSQDVDRLLQGLQEDRFNALQGAPNFLHLTLNDLPDGIKKALSFR